MKNVMRKIASVMVAVAVVFVCLTASAFAETTSAGVAYSAYVQDTGWMSEVNNGATAGTADQSIRIEALRANLTNAPEGAHINYQVHVQDKGWTAVASDGAPAGTTGESKRIEAISMTISGMNGYSIDYRVDVQGIGWMNWAKNGAITGTTGQSKSIVAIQIRLDTNTVESISITPAMTLTANGVTGTITAIVEPISEVNNIIWLSDNTSVATISKGIVTAVAAGTATITASAGGETAACQVTVTNDVDNIGRRQVLNGGFETGNLKNWLVSGGSNFPVVQNTTASEGQYASFMGDGASGLYNGGSHGTASISQSLNIVKKSATPYLNLDYMVDGQDRDGSGFDSMSIYINDNLIGSWWSDTAGWKTLHYDLSAYKGQTINLKINSWTRDGSFQALYYVDSISITYE